jgi:hypothetical protein
MSVIKLLGIKESNGLRLFFNEKIEFDLCIQTGSELSAANTKTGSSPYITQL